jgi:hypothetical protein
MPDEAESQMLAERSLAPLVNCAALRWLVIFSEPND